MAPADEAAARRRVHAALTVPTARSYSALAGVATLAVGSAKVPHLPCLDDVILAEDEVAAQRGLVAHASRLEGFAETLRRSGYASMATTVREAVELARRNVDIIDGRRPAVAGVRPERLNSALRSVLEWVYTATFKTAGAATMQFAPWYASDSGDDRHTTLARTEEGRDHVVISEGVYERIAAANAVIYERGVGLINEAHATLPGAAGEQAVVDRAVASLEGDDRRPRFEGPLDLKAMLKIDYKHGGDGRLYMVDLNAGTIGAYFDDDLLRSVLPGLEGWDPIVDRHVDTVMGVFGMARGRRPVTAVVTVVDEQMYDQWDAADLRGLIRGLAHAMGDRDEEARSVAVITMTELYAYAEDLDDDPLRRRVLGGVPWPGRPDVVVNYGWGTRHVSREAYRRLNDAGILTIDAAQHALVAAKDFALGSLVTPCPSARVVVPSTVKLGTVGAALADGDVCDRVWSVARATGWPALVVKTQKQRRMGRRGDFQSAYIYPTTTVGRRVAGRLTHVLKDIEAAGGGNLPLTVSSVELGGGLADPDGLRRDVELRSYAFPVTRD